MAHHTGNIFPSSSPAYRSNLKRKETNKRTTTTPQFLGPTGAGSLAKRWPCANCISFPYASPCALRKSWNSRRWSWNPWSPAICCEVVLFCFVGGKQRWLACGESQEKYRGRKGGKVKAPPGWSWETPPGYSSLFFLLELDICFWWPRWFSRRDQTWFFLVTLEVTLTNRNLFVKGHVGELTIPAKKVI